MFINNVWVDTSPVIQALDLNNTSSPLLLGRKFKLEKALRDPASDPIFNFHRETPVTMTRIIEASDVAFSSIEDDTLPDLGVVPPINFSANIGTPDSSDVRVEQAPSPYESLVDLLGPLTDDGSPFNSTDNGTPSSEPKSSSSSETPGVNSKIANKAALKPKRQINKNKTFKFIDEVQANPNWFINLQKVNRK